MSSDEGVNDTENVCVCVQAQRTQFKVSWEKSSGCGSRKIRSENVSQ